MCFYLASEPNGLCRDGSLLQSPLLFGCLGAEHPTMCVSSLASSSALWSPISLPVQGMQGRLRRPGAVTALTTPLWCARSVSLPG